MWFLIWEGARVSLLAWGLPVGSAVAVVVGATLMLFGGVEYNDCDFEERTCLIALGIGLALIVVGGLAGCWWTGYTHVWLESTP